jgi:hypothetical protein
VYVCGARVLHGSATMAAGRPIPDGHIIIIIIIIIITIIRYNRATTTVSSRRSVYTVVCVCVYVGMWYIICTVERDALVMRNDIKEPFENKLKIPIRVGVGKLS